MASTTNNLAVLSPELAKQWHAARNGDLTPREVVARSSRRVWWQCPVAPDHEWQAPPCDRFEGKGGCPFCLGMRVPKHQSLAATAPAIAREWHAVENGRLTPSDVTATMTRVVWWNCRRDPKHEWRESIRKRVVGSKCPFCEEETQKRAAEGKGFGNYVLCLESDRDHRTTMTLFLRSRAIESIGARDMVEASRVAMEHGDPMFILTSDSEEEVSALETFPHVPRHVVSAGALRMWLAAPEGSEASVPRVLSKVERMIQDQLRRDKGTFNGR